MQSKIPLKRLLSITGIIGIGLSLIIILFLTFYLQGHAYIYYIKSTSTSFETPVRLIIPKIGVDAVVESLGLTSDGAMDVPKVPNDVAWFNLGPRPGENGSAVIAGHYGFWKNGKGSVFDDLNKLRKGDKIFIEDKKGTIIAFVVRELKRYDQAADVPEVFNLNDGKSHLNLITCEGIWDKDKKTYSDRLIIFTDRE